MGTPMINGGPWEFPREVPWQVSWDPMGCHRDIEALLDLVYVAVLEATAASVGISRARDIAASIGVFGICEGAAAPAPVLSQK